MSRRTDVCREFARGSCRFGSKCKFLHDTSQQRQQTNNPFGFGLQNKPNANKSGNYFSPLTSSQTQNKNASQPQAKEHRCSDPKECKLQIKEDFENERPAYWRLTCYAHWKYLPNDISGDISFEELRAYAYSAGKQGTPYADVVQNERSMFDAKNKEFQNFANKPYSTSSGFHGSGTLSPFGSASADSSKMSFGVGAAGSPMSFGVGSKSNTSPFGTNAPFGAGATPFGTNAPFGAGATTNTQPFGTNTSFGAGATTNTPPFGTNTSFGAGATTNTPPFGTNTSFGAGTTSNTTPFGISTSFGIGAPGNTTPFGTNTAFGAGTTGNTAPFGTNTAFGANATGNTMPFGTSTHQSGPSQHSSQISAKPGSGGFSFGLGASAPSAGSIMSSAPLAAQNSSTPAFSFGVQSFGQGSQIQTSPFQAVNTSPLNVNTFGMSTQVPATTSAASEITINSTTDQVVTSTGNSDIWLKVSWKLGEIPEEEPPIFAR